MARTLNGSNQYLERASQIASAPFTFGAGFNIASSDLSEVVMAISKADAVNYWMLDPRGDVTGDHLEFHVGQTSQPGVLIPTTNSFGAGSWHTACAVESNSASRAVFLDGAGKATNTATRLPQFTVTTIGALALNNARIANLVGSVAEAYLYAAALTDQDAEAIGKLFCPLLVAPKSLLAYWPLGGALGNADKDRVGTADMTPYGTPTWGEHPKTIYPCDAQCC